MIFVFTLYCDSVEIRFENNHWAMRQNQFPSITLTDFGRNSFQLGSGSTDQHDVFANFRQLLGIRFSNAIGSAGNHCKQQRKSRENNNQLRLEFDGKHSLVAAVPNKMRLIYSRLRHKWAVGDRTFARPPPSVIHNWTIFMPNNRKRLTSQMTTATTTKKKKRWCSCCVTRTER